MVTTRGSLAAAVLCFCSALFVVTAAIGPAAAEARVIVRVLDEAGAPAQGVELVLVSAAEGWKPKEGATPARLTSDKKGKAAFGFVKQPADYILSATQAGKTVVKAAVKMRDRDRKPVRGRDGEFIKDIEGAVDPKNPVVPLSITSNADTIDVELTMGVPQVAARPTGPSGDVDIANKELKAAATAAVASIQAGQFEQALPQIDVLLEKRTELTPEDVAALLYMKGFSLYKLQREAEAEPLLTESTQLNPKVEPTFELLSVVLVHQKKWDEAIAAIRADLDLTPDDPNRRFTKMVNLGLALREAGRIDEAIGTLEEASRIAPADQSVVVALADAYTVAGRPDDADKLLQLQQLSAPEAAVLHFNIAASLVRQKNYAGAERHFRKVIELDPSIVDARRYLGEMLLSQNKRPEAIEAFEAYLQAAPNAPDAAEIKQMVEALKKEQQGKSKKPK